MKEISQLNVLNLLIDIVTRDTLKEQFNLKKINNIKINEYLFATAFFMLRLDIVGKLC